jgi:exonuclease VII large subunit
MRWFRAKKEDSQHAKHVQAHVELKRRHDQTVYLTQDQIDRLAPRLQQEMLDRLWQAERQISSLARKNQAQRIELRNLNEQIAKWREEGKWKDTEPTTGETTQPA